MNNTLTDLDKKNLTELFESFKVGETTEKDTKTLEDWKIYEKKILEKDLTLDDYTSSMERAKDNELPGGYLCNFLERSSIVFGYSRPGSSYQYMVHLDAKDSESETYYIKDKDSKKASEKESKEKATEVFKLWIKPLFQSLCTAAEITDLANIEKSPEYDKYEAKQILRKAVILNNLNKKNYNFIFIYKNETIDFLYDFLFEKNKENKDKGFFEKNNEILKCILKILNIRFEELDLNKLHKISDFLWNIANANGLTTEKSPNTILYGAPGTGKTYSVRNNINFITKKDPALSEFVQFHPSFTYEDFIGGLKPVGITDTGNMKFEFVNGCFKDFCIKAKQNPDNIYYFVVDEINRANLSNVFGETLSLLEYDYRDNKKDKDGNRESNLISTQNCKILESLINNSQNEKEKEKLINLAYDCKKDNEGMYTVKFGIPANIRFIGMMNDVDKSIDTFDLALRRRFKWLRTNCDYDAIASVLSENNEDKIDEYIDCCQKLNNYISKDLELGSSYEFGHSFFMKISNDKITKTSRSELFNDYLRPTLKEYLRSFYEESEIDEKLRIAFNIFLNKK